ncbi:MAG: aminotransferase class V-fold PLP-dependent enzyme [Bacteroidota bacterium]
MSPLLRKVEKAGIAGIKQKRKPFHVTPSDFFKDTDTLRHLFAQLIKAEDARRCVIIPSVSYGMANVANNLQAERGKNIVLAGEQFPSNVYPWKRLEKDGMELKFVAAPDTFDQRGSKWNEAILEAITSETKLVAIAHVHWADGTLFDLKAIRKKTREVGALLVIDGTQSVGALPIDVSALQPDALIVAGYKWLMGPYSIGMAYYGEAFDGGRPVEENWINRKESSNFNNLINYQDQYEANALRYEVGEHSNFILVPMLIAALKQILRWEPANIQQYCSDLVSPFLTEIDQMGGIVEVPEWRGSHLIGLRFRELDVEKAQKIFKQNKVSVSTRGTAIRVSPHVYNDERDMKKLMRSLQLITRKGQNL